MKLERKIEEISGGSVVGTETKTIVCLYLCGFKFVLLLVHAYKAQPWKMFKKIVRVGSSKSSEIKGITAVG